jgi:hypothetical protein
MLIGCEKTEDAKVKLMGLPNEPVIEQDYLYAHNALSPNYASLIDGNESLLDWDDTTYSTEKTEYFVFEKREKIVEIEILSVAQTLTIHLGEDTIELIHPGGWMVLEIETDELSEVVIETDGMALYECHIVSSIKMTQEEFDVYSSNQKMKEAYLGYDWFSDPVKNIEVAKSLKHLPIQVEPVEYTRLSHQIGYPVYIQGQILSVEKEGLYKILINTFIYEDPIILWSESLPENDKFYEGRGIYLGVNKTFEFYLME